MFVGIGLARFAYTPLLPAIISAGWFPPDQAAYLGAANLAGYLAGALMGHRLARHTSTRTAARALMLLTADQFRLLRRTGVVRLVLAVALRLRLHRRRPDGDRRAERAAARAGAPARPGQRSDLHRRRARHRDVGNADADAAVARPQRNLAGLWADHRGGDVRRVAMLAVGCVDRRRARRAERAPRALAAGRDARSCWPTA